MISVKILIASFGLLISNAFTATEDAITGNWKAAEMENSTIEVYKANDGYFYGKIIESDKSEWVGEIILKKVKYDPKENVWKGMIYSLERKMSINATLSLESDKRLKLVGKKLFITKTFYWQR